MNIDERFSMEVSPAILLIDPQGRRMKIAGPHHAEKAILAADTLHALSGTGKTVTAVDEDGSNPSTPGILLYYRSHAGRPTKEEIARVARILARSEIREALKNGTSTLRARGSRCVVFPEMLVPVRDVAVFVVSKRVWYNENRSVDNFPCSHDHVNAFLQDLNTRLHEGVVSCEKP